jgi:hypothetical protein
MPKNREQAKAAKKEEKEPEVDLITPNQVEVLQYQLELCDPEYAEKLKTYIESQGVSGLSKIRANIYAKILNGLMKNVEIYQRSINAG